MDEKAQTSIEYLLIIVGAIIIATTIAIYIKTTATSTTQAIQDQIKE
jgi:uncharacterized protein (UPF0333 family)